MTGLTHEEICARLAALPSSAADVVMVLAEMLDQGDERLVRQLIEDEIDDLESRLSTLQDAIHIMNSRAEKAMSLSERLEHFFEGSTFCRRAGGLKLRS